MSEIEQILTKHLDQFLRSRDPPKTFCPSEVARALNREELVTLAYETWRDAMAPIRELVWQRRDAGDCEVLQRGHVLPVDTLLQDVKGPIRVRRST